MTCTSRPCAVRLEKHVVAGHVGHRFLGEVSVVLLPSRAIARPSVDDHLSKGSWVVSRPAKFAVCSGQFVVAANWRLSTANFESALSIWTLSLAPCSLFLEPCPSSLRRSRPVTRTSSLSPSARPPGAVLVLFPGEGRPCWSSQVERRNQGLGARKPTGFAPRLERGDRTRGGAESGTTGCHPAWPRDKAVPHHPAGRG